MASQVPVQAPQQAGLAIPSLPDDRQSPPGLRRTGQAVEQVLLHTADDVKARAETGATTGRFENLVQLAGEALTQTQDFAGLRGTECIARS